MQQMTSELKQQIEWRKSQVLELSSQGYTEREIALGFKLNDTAVHRDLVYLRRQAQENLQRHIHEIVPEEYQKGMVGLRQNLKHVLEIAETSSDPRVKLEARRIANDCYRYIMDLTINGIIVTDAIKYVQGKDGSLEYCREKKLLQDIKNKGEDPESESESEDKGLSENSERELEERQTHNGIF